MDKPSLEQRTKRFALEVIRFVSALPRSRAANVLGHQLLKAGTSVGANYREANRAESRNDFIHKIAIVEKEAAEARYWLELCQESRLGDPGSCRQLLGESNELLAIFTAIGRTAKRRYRAASAGPTPKVREETARWGGGGSDCGFRIADCEV